MFKLRYFICIVVIAIFIPNLTSQHFIWPLDWCVLADFCNHTWIPECGVTNTSEGLAHFRLFIDECDMFEYNCDNDKNYELTNYSLCYGAACLDNDDKKQLRLGDYRVVGKERQLVYDPTNAYGQLIYTTTTKKFTFPSTTKPNLPKYMMQGRRRFTPYGPLWGRRHVAPDTTKAQKRRTRYDEITTKKKKRKRKKATKKITSTKAESLRTIVIKKVTFKRKNGTFMRVFKAIVKKATTVTSDDDYLE